MGTMEGTKQARWIALEASKMVLDAAFKIHSHFCPGLLESVYEACLAQELRDKDLKVETQVPVPVFFNGTKLEVGYHIDLLVEDMVVVEIKSVEVLAPVHKAQTLS